MQIRKKLSHLTQSVKTVNFTFAFALFLPHVHTYVKPKIIIYKPQS